MMTAFFKGKECDEYELFRKPDLDDFWWIAWCNFVVFGRLSVVCDDHRYPD